jgi:hypothetical protein
MIFFRQKMQYVSNQFPEVASSLQKESHLFKKQADPDPDPKHGQINALKYSTVLEWRTCSVYGWYSSIMLTKTKPKVVIDCWRSKNGSE